MQPSGGGGSGGGGGSSVFDTPSTHPGIPQKKEEEVRRREAGPTTVFEFVQGFTPMPNPVARTILSDTSLSPEQQQIHANLMGLRNGGSVGFRPLVPGYAEAGLVDLGAISTADAPRRATPEEMEDARRIETMSMLRFYLGEAEGRKDLPPDWKSLSANTLNELFQEWQKDPEAARKTWEGLSAEMRQMKKGADAGGEGIEALMAPMAPTREQEGTVYPLHRGGPEVPFEDDLSPPRESSLYSPEDWGAVPGTFAPGYNLGFKASDAAPHPATFVDQSGATSFGGYAHGGYASRGTVAGELPRYGNMSVREEGESMRELAKRHKEQDWYNRMRQSPTLGKVRIA